MAGLFLVKREAIQKTLRDTGVWERLFKSPPPEAPDDPEVPDIPVPNMPAEEDAENPAVPEVPVPPEPSGGTPAAEPPTNAPPPPSPREPVPERSRERPVYFMRLDRDGTIVRTRITKPMPASDSPMLDVLGVLLRGPSEGEKQDGLVSLIPPGTRILSATVRGDTAYISFSEEFQYNTYGVEGYAAQLRQIVWTVTEFSTVKDVQILIEGRRVDYLGEGIWIGSPINRDTF
jgi:spore germination protein GerM